MEIIKSKRKAKCWRCGRAIELKYRVQGNNKRNYHLRCYRDYCLGQLENFKRYVKMFNRMKLKKQIILEGLK
jgi:hypothetical protein